MSLTGFNYLYTFKWLLISLYHLVQWNHVVADYCKDNSEVNGLFASLFDFTTGFLSIPAWLVTLQLLNIMKSSTPKKH